MQIKILKTHETAIDCRTIVEFKKDEIVDVDDNVANSLIRNGLGIIFEEKMLPKFENKAIFNTPENKVEESEIDESTETEEVKEIKITNKKNKK